MELTRAIAAAIDRRRGQSDTAQALNIAIGAMVAHDTAMGIDAFAGLDVERVFSAVQMLADRRNVELSPFVSSWNSAIESLGESRHFPGFFQEDFRKELNRRSGAGFEELFRRGVEFVTTRNPDRVFARLEREMLTALTHALRVDESKIDYLAPILNSTGSPAQVVTLNYDRSIELLAERHGRKIDTGVDRWSGAFDWDWANSADIRLLKMHGSIDWWIEEVRATEGRLSEEAIVVVGPGDEAAARRMRPALIFGQRGKLRSDGPFLAMLRAFDDFLSSTDELVVVGYSFRDDHINASIRRWLNSRDDASLTVIDPAMDARTYRQGSGTFRDELIGFMTIAGNQETGWDRPPRGEHRLLATTAARGLPEVFGP